MSSGPEFTKAAIEQGIPPAFAEAVVRYLGDDEIVPRLRRGRPPAGNRDARWEAGHYAAGILGFGTSLPINAPEVAQTLGTYEWVRSTKHWATRDKAGKRTGVEVKEDTDVEPNRSCLRSAIERLVLLNASKTASYREEALQVMLEHSIVLSVDGGTASISYQYEDDYWVVDYYSAPPAVKNHNDQRVDLRRKVSVELPFTLVVACGGLLAETLATRPKNLPFPSSDEAPGSAEPETTNENAAVPGSTAARTRKRNRPRSNATGANYTSPENRGVEEFPQPSSSRPPVITQEGVMTHDVAYSNRR